MGDVVPEPILQVSGSQTSGNIRVMGKLVKVLEFESTLGGNNLRDPDVTFRKGCCSWRDVQMHFES